MYGLHVLGLTDEETGRNVEVIKVTEDHPFYVEGQGWTVAEHLSLGMRVQNPDGTWSVVSGNTYEVREQGVTVYNFEVEGGHTYFVADDQGDVSAVWVHNSCYGSRHWRRTTRRELLNRSGRFSMTNIQRMLNGDAPLMRVLVQNRRMGQIATKEFAVELHHWRLPQRSNAAIKDEAWNLAPVSRWAHEALDEFRHAGWDLLKMAPTLSDPSQLNHLR